MAESALSIFRSEIEDIRAAGLYKDERIITSDQDADIRVLVGGDVINFCANNYLGLANDGELVARARDGLSRYGFGMASVRFICGTLDIHKELEDRISDFLRTDDAILYSSCFDANAGLFEALLDAECAVISDELNHASIIDGIRLCKAERHRYGHGDMEHLERILKETQDAKIRMIATDGVFSMDGDVAPLRPICDLADAYDALVTVDDSHATGFFGKTGRGSIEHCGVMGRVDIVTSTLGKALGGASGGFTAARREIVELLRQRSRPYLFSNTVAPVIVYATLGVLDRLDETTDLRDRLEANTRFFRSEMTQLGFDIRPGIHPIVPIMLYDARTATRMASDLLEEGIYVIGFSYPVVPKNQARIRVQISAAHQREHLEKAIDAFGEVGRRYDVIS